MVAYCRDDSRLSWLKLGRKLSWFVGLMRKLEMRHAPDSCTPGQICALAPVQSKMVHLCTPHQVAEPRPRLYA
jgi:hypothetical protein